MRRDLVEMLFHEGNHLCPICEASGNCELQAMAYRLGMTERRRAFPIWSPAAPVDASHPDIALDTNRCISCGRCIRASQDVDGKGVFGYVGRGIHRRVAVNGPDLAHTDCEHHRCRRLCRGLPGGLHHPQARGLLGADRRAGIRQGPDRYDIEGEAR
jgi:[NiFe] hydrogenase diaphorase moiety small subunit